MSAQTIYTKLVQAGMSPVGACAMLGNMQAESALKANNVENRCTMTDAEYTATVDAGGYDFARDYGNAYGYGLCQWTYPTRKAKLLNLAKKRGVSVGDEAMQVDFCIQELQTEYPKLWSYLCSATGVYEAAERICVEYERPAVNNVDVRAKSADSFYMSYGGMEIGSTPLSPTEAKTECYWPPRTLGFSMSGPDVVALQGMLNAHGYSLSVTGLYDNNTKSAVEAFQKAKSLAADGIAGPKTWTKLTER